MARRLGIILATTVVALLVMTDGAWACRCMNGMLAADPRFRFRPNIDDDDYYIFRAEFEVKPFADFPVLEYKFSEYVNLENYVATNRNAY